MCRTLLITALTVALAVSSMAGAPPQARPGHAWSASGYVPAVGRRFTVTITDDDMSDTPEWADPGTVPPPLPLRQAVSASRTVLARYVPDPGSWQINEVDLHRFGDDRRWFYLVGWSPRSPTYLGDGILIPVLMNGRCIEPKTKIEPNPVKDIQVH